MHFPGKLVLFAAGFSLFTGASCTLTRAAWHFKPDTSDYRHFPARTIENGQATFQFHHSPEAEKLGRTLQISDRFVQNFVSLDHFVQRYHTEAFLIIRNDTILYEKYPGGHEAATPVTTFSVSKAVMTTLVGIAVQEGYIRSIDQPVTDFLPEWKNYSQVRIRNLMNHNSGIRFNHSLYSPASDEIYFYYGKNLRKRLKNRGLQATPGERFDYNSANTTLLALVLEQATGRSISKYLEEKVWQPLGMEAPASWTLDGKGEAAVERAFCCLQARAMDYAKIGRLWLCNGEWQGQQLFPENWLNDILTAKNPLPGPYRCGFTHQSDGSFFASGLYGQFIFVHPAKQLLILRFGEHRKGYTSNFWRDVLRQVADGL